MKTPQQRSNVFTKNSTPQNIQIQYLSYGSQFSRFLLIFYVSKQVFYKKWQDSRQLTVFVYLLFIIIITEQLIEMYTQSLPLLPTIMRTIGTCSYYQHKNVFTIIIYTCTLLYVGIGTDILLLQKRAPSFLASTDRIVKLFSKFS